MEIWLSTSMTPYRGKDRSRFRYKTLKGGPGVYLAMSSGEAAYPNIRGRSTFLKEKRKKGGRGKGLLSRRRGGDL